MLERRELHGYRDGADWKFKAEDIDRLGQARRRKPAADEDGGDVLLSEVALGQSDPGLSGTVIGMSGGRPHRPDSDIRLAESDIQLGDGVRRPRSPKKKSDSDAKGDQVRGVGLDPGGRSDPGGQHRGDRRQAARRPAAVPPSTWRQGIDDDDLVLGGSGKGSDVTIGGDSGISLVDPSDSGLSLETPLNLGPVAEESLELGEDDMLTTSETADEGRDATEDRRRFPA